MNHHHKQSDGDGSAPDALLPEDEPQHGQKRGSSRGSAGTWFRLSREARIGTAALLSFLILVTALVVQKWKNPAPSGKQPPVAKIASPEVASAAPTAQPPTSPVGILGHPEKAKGTDKDQQRIASGTGAPPLPSSPVVTSDLPPPVSPDPKVPYPATELAQYTPPSSHEPALPPSTASAPESGLAEAPVTALPPELPTAASASAAVLSPGPAQTSSASVEVPPSATGSELLGPIAEERKISDRPSLPAQGQGPAPVALPSPSGPSPSAVEAGIGPGVDASVVPAPFTPPPLSPAGNPDSDSSPKRSPKAPKKKGQAPTDSSRQPAAIAAEPSGGPPRSSELPNFATAPESVDPLSAGAPTANPFADPNASAGQGGWVQLPNAAIRQSDAEALNGRGGERGPEIAHTGAANVDAGHLVESVPHVVARGENFFSIAQQYYGSGRFYPALWKANSDQVPAPEKLRVGQTIRIPPPEALDRSQILPPRTTLASGSQSASAVPRTVRSGPANGRSSAVALALPVADPFSDRNRSGDGASPEDHVAPPSGSPSDRSRLPRYKIRPQETLRSIARDTLGDSRRAGEILELNREVIDDPNYLTTGQEIELPEDARLTRRVRSAMAK